jgi:putative phosphoribosyl transferase
MRPYQNRYEAGKLLGEELAGYAERPDVLVLGLARGGVPVAFEVARRLRVPFDVCLVRKLGVPSQPELAMGAVAAGGPVVVNRDVTDSLGISDAVIESAAEQERREIGRRERLYRDGRRRLDLTGRTVILVDDGLATGATMVAAVRAARQQSPARVVVAAPVGAPATIEQLRQEADDVTCVMTSEFFFAVGEWYVDFAPTTDEEVQELLAQEHERKENSSKTEQSTRRNVSVPAGHTKLKGELTIPAGASGLVLFAHGAGSSRHSPRNQFVARVLHDGGLGTLLMDLLTEEEEASEHRTVALRFDIDLLARRLIAATDWVSAHYGDVPIGYFGASTGAAAALVAAAERPERVTAVVSRGGRPDLARFALSRVRAPTLLIVGGSDSVVLELNREVYRELDGPKRLEIVPRATHLFEEPGALERVADLARDWFEDHLATSPHGHVDRTRFGAPAHGPPSR